MSQLCRNPTFFPAEPDTGFADLDHVPLTTRRRLLLSSDRVHGVSQRTKDTAPTLKDDIAVKKGLCAKENGHGTVSNAVASESVVTEISESAGVGCSRDIGESGNLKACDNPLAGSNAEEDSGRVGNVEENLGYDDLGHITLKERQKILLKRMTLTSARPNIERNFQESSDACDGSNPDKIKAAISCEIGVASFSGSQFGCFLEKIDSILCRSFSIGSESGSQFSGTRERNDSTVKERPLSGSPEGTLSGFSDVGYGYSPLASSHAAAAKKPRISVKKTEKDSPSLNKRDRQGLTSQNCVQVKVEPSDGCPTQNVDGKIPGNFEKVQVKREVEIPHEVYENGQDCASYCTNPPTPAQNPSISVEHVLVKREVETAHEVDEDELDHMTLCERMNLPTSSLKSTSSHNYGEDLNSASEFSSPASKYIKPLRMLRPRKRKKTATDSIETALEEDAPGLLQVLLNQGVIVDELKLYGETDCVDELNDSLIEESFSELEAVMSQLFLKRETCTKLLPLRYTKGSKASYCLTCLFSLVEQARYLRFRKWPVEWGWCRDLQSFIFVFERHKRIVMERPEYGYATYFFELVDTLPIEWQIKRLVIAMKLAGCGRNVLIENKALLVGEDLTEGDAQVLMKYGWLPNTGLGTMLNYRDRVFHDRKSEKDTSEWRSKICNLLVDGYTSGTIISTMVPENETGAEYRDAANAPHPQVKLEQC